MTTKRRIVGLCLGLVVAFVAVFAIYRVRLERNLDERIQGVLEAGQPTTITEVRDWVNASGPRETDAWMEELRTSYVAPGHERELLPFFGEDRHSGKALPLSAEVAEAIEVFVSENQDLLGRVRRIVEEEPPPLRWGFRPPVSQSDDLIRSQRVRNITSLLRLNAIFGAERGESDRAFETIAGLIALAGASSYVSMMVPQLESDQMLWTASIAYGEVSPHVALTAEQLGALQALIEKRIAPLDLKRVLLAEQGMVLAQRDTGNAEDVVIREPGMAGILDEIFPYTETLLWSHRIRGTITLDYTRFIDGYDEYLQAVLAAPYDRGHAGDEFTAEYAGRNPKSRLLLVALSNARGLVTRLETFEAVREALRAAIATERFQRESDIYPAKLDDLVPKFLTAVPLDPFDGQALRYYGAADWFVVYSVGEDVRDDGGDPEADIAMRGGKSGEE